MFTLDIDYGNGLSSFPGNSETLRTFHGTEILDGARTSHRRTVSHRTTPHGSHVRECNLVGYQML